MGLDWVWPWVFRRVWLRFCVTKRERERERERDTHTHTMGLWWFGYGFCWLRE